MGRESQVEKVLDPSFSFCYCSSFTSLRVLRAFHFDFFYFNYLLKPRFYLMAVLQMTYWSCSSAMNFVHRLLSVVGLRNISVFRFLLCNERQMRFRFTFLRFWCLVITERQCRLLGLLDCDKINYYEGDRNFCTWLILPFV